MLQQFQKGLENLFENPILRPFVCEGSPLDCKIFIVGFNPATPMKESWWDFWRPEYGFDKKTWLEAYIRTKKGKTSKTRTVFELIVDEAKPIKCLETNIYSTPSKGKRDFPKDAYDTSPFDFLLETIRPQVMIVYDKDAIKHIENKLNIALKLDNLQSENADWGLIKVIAVQPHLSNDYWQYNEKRIREIGRKLRDACSP